MKDNTQLSNMINYIEQNLRASSSAGLKFIDLRNFKGRLVSQQNHVIYGRRGAGKSTLVSSTSGKRNIINIRVDVENFKDITFPNIIIHLLLAAFEDLRHRIGSRWPIWKFNTKAYKFQRRMRSSIAALRELLGEPDFEEKKVRTKTVREVGTKDEARVRGKMAPIDAEFGTGQHTTHANEEEIMRIIPTDKLVNLRKKLSDFKLIFQEASSLLGSLPIFLILDDFYFIPKSTQPHFIDYFHRISKDTLLYLKIATIKHRTRIYMQTEESYVGVEPEHDVYIIDMDYTLDKFSDLRSFMNQLLESSRDHCRASIDIGQLFSGGGFDQLCLASGGVPRDFLALFVRLGNRVIAGEIDSIGKVAVTEEAINNIGNKMASMKTDSAEEKEVLEKYLQYIKDFVYNDRRTNAFLVPKAEIDSCTQERQAIRELVDLRLLHLVDGNTSAAPSDGRRYEAYILDLGLYDNPRPRNFNQIEPGTRDDRSRRDELRGAPRISLITMKSSFDASGDQGKLMLTDV